MAAFVNIPILPVGEGVSDVIYRGDFVRALQQALIDSGYDLAPYGGADGLYGPGTARVLKTYQDEHPFSTQGEGVIGDITGYPVASCGTYNALGLQVYSVKPVAGVTAPESVVRAIMAAVDAGLLDLSCGIGEPPEEKPEGFWGRYGTAVVLGAGMLLVIAGGSLLRKG